MSRHAAISGSEVQPTAAGQRLQSRLTLCPLSNPVLSSHARAESLLSARITFLLSGIFGNDNSTSGKLAAASHGMMAPPFKSTETNSLRLPGGRVKLNVSVPLPEK